jgi:hypothetical protein
MGSLPTVALGDGVSLYEKEIPAQGRDDVLFIQVRSQAET